MAKRVHHDATVIDHVALEVALAHHHAFFSLYGTPPDNDVFLHSSVCSNVLRDGEVNLMALRFFHLVVEGKLVADRIGEDAASSKAAARRAADHIAAFKNTELGARLDYEGCLIEVADVGGRTITYVPFKQREQ